MTTYRLSTPLVGLLIVAWSATTPAAKAGDDAAAVKAADQKFAELLAAAQKDPSKTDWKALRRAFADTSHYEPYSITWRKDLSKVAKDMREGDVKAAEAALVKLIERERFMRIDGHTMAASIYEKLGETEKAQKHRDFLEGLLSALLVPEHGTSLEKPFEVLFLDEEYYVIGSLGLKVKEQALTEHDGHHFDVLTTHATAGKPEQQFYFNIDRPWNWLQASLKPALEKSKEPAGKR